VSAAPYLTELALPERMLKSVEVLDVLLMRPVLNEQRPLDLLVLAPEVQSQGFLRGQYDLERPVLVVLVLADDLVHLFRLLNKGAHEGVKEDPLLLLTVLIEHEVVALHNQPERFELVHIRFQEAMPLCMCFLRVTVLSVEAIVVQDIWSVAGLLGTFQGTRKTLHVRLL